MSREEGGDYASIINSYLSALTGVEKYVIVSEGFPIYWSRSLDQSKAEELAARAIDTINGAAPLRGSNNEYFIVSTETADTYMAVTMIKDLLILAEGEPDVVRRSLYNLYRHFSGGLRCPWCGEDLSLHTFKCPSGNHILPLGMTSCPFCHKNITSIECPKCEKKLSPYLRRLIARRPLHALVMGLTLLVMGALLIFFGYMLEKTSPIGGYISMASALIIFWLSYNTIKQKEIIEEKTASTSNKHHQL